MHRAAATDVDPGGEGSAPGSTVVGAASPELDAPSDVQLLVAPVMTASTATTATVLAESQPTRGPRRDDADRAAGRTGRGLMRATGRLEG